MSGIVNSRGAKSGVIGTTVGTTAEVAAANAGTSAFLAGGTDQGWLNLTTGSTCAFGSSSDDCFNEGGHYNYSTYIYTAPAAGVYMFGYNCYTGNTDSDNMFAFNLNGTNLDQGTGVYPTRSETALDASSVSVVCLDLSTSDALKVVIHHTSDFYGPYSGWWGCRIS